MLTLFLFLMAASRMYDPMQGALQNLAAVIAMRTNVGRMNEILDAPLQTGSEQLTNQGCDIVFDHVGFAYNSGETVLRDVSFTAKQGRSRHWWAPLAAARPLFPAGSTVLGLPEGQHHRGRHGGFPNRPGKAHEPVFHRFSGCDPV